jgi:hypothetical protein
VKFLFDSKDLGKAAEGDQTLDVYLGKPQPTLANPMKAVSLQQVITISIFCKRLRIMLENAKKRRIFGQVDDGS